MHSLEKLKENSVWYDANLDSLLPKCRSRHVAIAEVDWESAGGIQEKGFMRCENYSASVRFWH